jgi:predicted site-specific integrase-resolvase
MNSVYTKKAAAKILGVSAETLDRYRKKGKLPYRQIGDRIVFTECDLVTFLDSCSIPATIIPTDREKLEMAKAVGGEI